MSSLKRLVKALIRWACLPPVLPVWVLYQLGRPVVGSSRALEGATQMLAGLPGTLGAVARGAFLRLVLAKCSPTAEVCYGTLLSQPGAVIEDRVYVGPRCHLGLVHLEADVLLAAGVHVPSGGATHRFDDPTLPIREQGGERRVVRIGRGAWVGSAAVVLADVGEGTIVGAGSVVTKPLPPNVIAAGVPAKVIRERFPGEPAT